MRPVLAVDLLCAGQAVYAAPLPERPAVARTLVRRSVLADRYRILNGRAHPKWGDGTLASTARHHGPLANGMASDPAFADALICVLKALIERRRPD